MSNDLGVGVIVSGATLTKRFDAYWRLVLSDRLEAQPKKGKGPTKYRIAKPLPDAKAEYNLLKNKRFTTTVEALVEDAYGTIGELADEMQEAYDAMPEGLQQGDVGVRRSEAADNLSNLNDQPEVPDGCKEITTIFLPHLDTASRPKRAQEAADRLNTAVVAIREKVEEVNDAEGDDDSKPDVSEWEELADKLENDAAELEGIDFPGMYG